MSENTSTALHTAILATLDAVKDPCSLTMGCPLGMVEMGLVRHISIEEGAVNISLRLTSPGCDFFALFQQAIIEQIGLLAGVRSVAVQIAYEDLSWSEDSIVEDGRKRLATLRQQRLLRLKDLRTQAQQNATL